MASPSCPSPLSRRHPTFDSLESPNNSECSVLFGPGTSPTSSYSSSNTPISRRDTLVLPQGFAGRNNIGANNCKIYSKVLPITPLALGGSERAATRCPGSSASKANGSFTSDRRRLSQGQDKENSRDMTSSRKQMGQPIRSSPSTTPSRSMRYSVTPKSTPRRRMSVQRLVEEIQSDEIPQASPVEPLANDAQVLQLPLDEGPPRRYVPEGAIGYDSDELTDADAEGSMEIWTDEEDDSVTSEEQGQDQDVGDVVALLDQLDVGVSLEYTSGPALHGKGSNNIQGTPKSPGAAGKDQKSGLEQAEAGSDDAKPDLEAFVDSMRESDGSRMVDGTALSDIVADTFEPPTHESLGTSEWSQLSPSESFLTGPEKTPITEDRKIDAIPSSSASAVSTFTPGGRRSPRKSPTEIAAEPSTPHAPAGSTTPLARPESITPAASETGSRVLLAAPTARRQLTKLSARSIPRAALNGRKIGANQEACTMLTSVPPTSTLKAVGNSGLRRAASAHSLLAEKRSLVGASSSSKLPSSLARKLAFPDSSRQAGIKVTSTNAPPSLASRPKNAQTHNTMARSTLLPSRPASAASMGSLGTSVSGNTTAKSKQIGPAATVPSEASSGSVKPQITRTVGSGAARSRSLLQPFSRGVTPSTSSATQRSVPQSGLATKRAFGASGSTIAPSRQASAPPGSSLTRQKPSPPGQTGAAPSTLASSTSSFTSANGVVGSVTRAAEASTSPARTSSILPRPGPTAPTLRSPDKRLAQRRDGPLERSGGPAKTLEQELAALETAQLQRQAVASPAVRTSPRRTAGPSASALDRARSSPAKHLPDSAAPRSQLCAEPSSLLTAPADRVDTLCLPSNLFTASQSVDSEVKPAPVPLPRPTRASRPQPQPIVSDSASTPASPVKEVVQLLPRPTRRSRAVIAEANATTAAESSVQISETPTSSLSARPAIVYNPPPALTQEELSRLTQKNTKRNQLNFNKLDVQTVYVDAERPPSPTSKIRRSISNEGSLGRPTTKEGREARAAKRRSALRSSTDGSELALLASELGSASGGADEQTTSSSPAMHYRAPGDEEDFFSPVRPQKTVKSKKKTSGVAAAAASTDATRKTVKWDRALVYEGPLAARNGGNGEPILKRTPLDPFGNSTATTTGFARPVPVQIIKMVYKNDQ